MVCCLFRVCSTVGGLVFKCLVNLNRTNTAVRQTQCECGLAGAWSTCANGGDKSRRTTKVNRLKSGA